MAPSQTVDETEWKTVTKQNKKRVATRSHRRPKAESSTGGAQDVAPLPCSSSSVAMTTSPENSLLQESFDRCMVELEKTAFFQNLKKVMFAVLADSTTSSGGSISIGSMVCYGIGNFAQCHRFSAPLWQLACAMSIGNLIMSSKQQQRENQRQGDDEQTSLSIKDDDNSFSFYYFEPCMTAQESEFLQNQQEQQHSSSFGPKIRIQIISRNERGKRLVQEPTLFFMPHCPMSLYTNVLNANWDCLKYVIIFGNSLSAYASRLLSKDNSHVRFLQALESYWKEDKICMAKEDVASMPGYFEQAFNDSSVTYFPPKVIETLKKNKLELPVLNDDDHGGEAI